MDKAILLDQLDWVQARIEEIEKQVLNYDPDGKGFKELVDGYNKLVDRYDKLLDSVEHFDDVSVEEQSLQIERDKLALENERLQSQINIEANKINLETERLEAQKNIEKDKHILEIDRIRTQDMIERDKIELEKERLQLDKDKFAYDMQNAPRKEIEDIIFRVVDVGTRLAVPVLGFMGIRYVANLSYMNDAELKLCNGRIAGGVKDMLKILELKV